MKVTAIIPTCNPNHHIVVVVQQLCEQGFSEIIIVNDGSDESYLPIFHELEENPCCTVLTHHRNEGKGQALKTAFRWYLTQPIAQQLGVITLDYDGQDTMESVVACARALEDDVESLTLGVRDCATAMLSSKRHPKNKTTAAVCARDTQTSLRGIPNRWLSFLTEVAGDRFEYESNMIMAAKQKGILIHEVRIRTSCAGGEEST